MQPLKKLFEKVLTREVIFYVFFGILTTATSFIFYAIFLSFGFGVILANTVSTFFAVLFAYTTNKIWVFRSLNFSIKAIILEFFKFLSSRFMAYIIDTLLLVILITTLLQDPIISKVFTSVLIIILNYITSKKIVFR